MTSLRDQSNVPWRVERFEGVFGRWYATNGTDSAPIRMFRWRARLDAWRHTR